MLGVGSKAMSEKAKGQILDPLARLGLLYNPMWQIVRGWTGLKIHYKKNMSLAENVLCTGYIICNLEHNLMKRNKSLPR